MLKSAKLIDKFNNAIGNAIAWCALLMVLVQFAVVVFRYIFSLSHPAPQESIWYLHGLLFMLGAGYTLLHNGHVRVDVFYATASERRKALVDLVGSLCLVIPLMIATIYLSWSYVLHSWLIFEGSTDLSGLPFLFLYKTIIWLFALLVGLQALSLALKALAFLCGKTNQYPINETEEPLLID